MACSHSVTTKTGTFTAYMDMVSRCQAEKRCKKRGEILAPISNRRDANKIMKLFRTNTKNESCGVSSEELSNYWIGLDVTYTEQEQEKVFSNGVKWKENKMSKIYRDYIKENKEYTECAIALLRPFLNKNPYVIFYEGKKCNAIHRYKYLCLKPNPNALSEPVNQVIESNISDIFVPSVVFAAASVFIICAYVAIKTNMKLKREKNQVKQQLLQAGVLVTEALNRITVDGKEERVQKNKLFV